MNDPNLTQLLVNLRQSAAQQSTSVESVVSAFFLESKPHETLGEFLRRQA